jgi:hypothetical protein
VISGATRGTGVGDALARHLLKDDENDVRVLPGRGLGAASLSGRIAELAALSAGARTERPVYHVHCSPDPDIADEAAARARFWALFECEFGMEAQPWCGVEHVKHNRKHEHRVYTVARLDGSVVDLRFDFVRREKVARIVEYEHGTAPVPSKHSRAIVAALRRDGRDDVADWLVAAGMTAIARPIAPLTPRERLIQERTGVSLDNVRREALAAWRSTSDGPGFLTALRERGLDLRQGRAGPVVVDASGTAHLATRVIGAAARRFEGTRIRAGEIKTRLNGMELELHGNGMDGDRAATGRAGEAAARDPRGDRAALGGGLGIRRPDLNPVGPDGRSRGRDGRGPGAALAQLRAIPVARGAALGRCLTGLDVSTGRHLAAMERAREAVERIEAAAMADRVRDWALWGKTDIWGLPLR